MHFYKGGYAVKHWYAAEIPALVMLTKVDTYDPDVIGNDLSKLFHSARLLHLIEVSQTYVVTVAVNPMPAFVFLTCKQGHAILAHPDAPSLLKHVPECY